MREFPGKWMMIMLFVAFAGGNLWGQGNTNESKFKQLKEELATPNTYRTASGAPGHAYWQQKADYQIKVELDDEKQIISGTETVTYHNNSPDALKYLWLQLDQNMRKKDSDRYKIETGEIEEYVPFDALKRHFSDYEGGFNIESVTDKSGKSLPFTINKTMMRIDMPEVLKPGGSYVFSVKWWYEVNDREEVGGRSGYEYFPSDGNYLYTIAQFYPRMAVYSDVEGWQHKQFLGRGEFALTFGDFDVEITVPDDHVVGATGVLQNEKDVLTATERSRMDKARTAFEQPVVIVTEEEADKATTGKPSGKRTWRFKAENVRDFAFCSSRKFIWDAMAVKFGDRTVLAMSYYPKEGNPLWEKYSTRVVAHTIKTYSKYTFDYPYPIAISVHTKDIGMEYPMICFNGGRPEADGTYSERTKHGMISVIIHEVGHNFFPMIINSDERQWTWMDEGLNTFLQYLTEKEWDRDYPSRRGPAYKIVEYMKGDKSQIVPIMTNSESLWQFGNNAYGKPATALNILRETILGRELFDFAFKEYAQRWMFKHPTPADLFRTLEDASGTDLDWFWRGWFYTNDHCDIALEDILWYQVDTRDPDRENPKMADQERNKTEFIGDTRNKESIPQSMVEKYPELQDFYNTRDKYAVSKLDKMEFQRYYDQLDEREKSLLDGGWNFYQLKFRNIGGLVMPLILEFTFADGSTEVQRIPAEIWKMSQPTIHKVFAFKKEVVGIALDPFLETADTDISNNYWPARETPSRFRLFKSGRERENEMQRYQREQEMER